jgi:hypothetical protein
MALLVHQDVINEKKNDGNSKGQHGCERFCPKWQPTILA